MRALLLLGVSRERRVAVQRNTLWVDESQGTVVNITIYRFLFPQIANAFSKRMGNIA
jgi:hypothetical protein